MRMEHRRVWPCTLATLVMAAALTACGPAADDGAAAGQAATDYTPVTVEHALGTTRVTRLPQRVVAFDMSELDTLDQLQAPVVGISKDYVSSFLRRYRDDAQVMDVGTTIQPNLERLHVLKPDLILISPLQAQSYDELSELAPTIHYDIDLNNTKGHVLEEAKQHLLTIGRILDKDALAQEKVAHIDATVAAVQAVTEGRPETALIVLHNNGALSSFGLRSRYGFIFDTFGVKSASPDTESGPHGQPISNEFVHRANPDIFFVIDRTAVMERRAVLNRDTLANPLLKQTKAWNQNKVFFVDPETWYLCTASLTCIDRMADDVIAAYR